ncbi:MAG TPA: TolC family protein [Kiritimatiellia bacterium]|nr:TolC family protein [Kiritimatiellia bacterium]
MKVYTRAILICLMVFFMPEFSTSTHADNIQTWLDDVDESNPSVIAARQRWLAAKAMVSQASSLPDPMIGFNVERNNTRFTDYMGFEYMFEQEVPWPGRLRVDREIARLEAEAVGFELLEVRRQTRAKITSEAWNLWAARKSRNLMREQEQLAASLVDTAQARLESGQVGQVEVLRLQIESERIRNQVITMEREVDVALARLNSLLNDDPQTFRSTEEMPTLPEFTMSLQQLQENARLYCCILMATLWREMARDLERKSARLEQRPDVVLRIEARQFRDSGNVEEYDTGVAFSFPWLWQGKYRGRKAEAEAEYLMAQAMLEEETAMTLTDIQEMYTDAENKLRNLRLYEEIIIPRTRALAETSREAYISGSLSVMEVIDAQRMLLDAWMNFYQESAAYAGAFARLMATAQPWAVDEFDFGLPLHMEGDQQ